MSESSSEQDTSGSSESGSKKKSAAKRPAKKSAAKRPAKKASSSDRPAKKTSAAKRSSSSGSSRSSDSSSSSGSNGSSGRKSRSSGASAVQVARRAAMQLNELTGRDVECVTSVQRDDDGWIVEVEAVESRRIPDTTDVLASYRVETDSSGELLGYRRQRRYVRGKGSEGDGDSR